MVENTVAQSADEIEATKRKDGVIVVFARDNKFVAVKRFFNY